MPYIDQDARARLAAGGVPAHAGELNYAITLLVDAYLARSAGTAGRTRYAHLNEAIGVLECAKLELYRRVTVPYEDEKIAESGDVYTVMQRGPSGEAEESSRA
jgi:hypothetical protein